MILTGHESEQEFKLLKDPAAFRRAQKAADAYSRAILTGDPVLIEQAEKAARNAGCTDSSQQD